MSWSGEKRRVDNLLWYNSITIQTITGTSIWEPTLVLCSALALKIICSAEITSNAEDYKQESSGESVMIATAIIKMYLRMIMTWPDNGTEDNLKL